MPLLLCGRTRGESGRRADRRAFAVTTAAGTFVDRRQQPVVVILVSPIKRHGNSPFPWRFDIKPVLQVLLLSYIGLAPVLGASFFLPIAVYRCGIRSHDYNSLDSSAKVYYTIDVVNIDVQNNKILLLWLFSTTMQHGSVYC